MSRQNRVTPFGEIIATPERGTFMGNRGVLHDDGGRIRRAWQLKRWLVCVSEFRGRKRSVMTPGHYTEMFFLDEATALAAGHRPCAECRRERFNVFRKAWQLIHPGTSGSSLLTAAEIDDRLHTERIASDHSKRSFMGNLDEMPDGVFATVEGWGEEAYLVWGDHLVAWSPGGYGERRRRPKGEEVMVLTPKSTVGDDPCGLRPRNPPFCCSCRLMDMVKMLLLYQDDGFTFRFVYDRIIPGSIWRASRPDGVSRYSRSTPAPGSGWGCWRRRLWAKEAGWTWVSRSSCVPAMRLLLRRRLHFHSVWRASRLEKRRCGDAAVFQCGGSGL